MFVDEAHMKKNKLLGGNWKLNCCMKTFDIVKEFKPNFFIGNDVFLAVPFPYIHIARTLFPEYIKVGAQDCSRFKNGAYTGEVSAEMIKELGAEYVLVGHSERRRWFSETPTMITMKVRNAINEGLKVVLCVGESLEDRENGRHLEVVKEQVCLLKGEFSGRSDIDIAYEPAWAIGTGKVPSSEQLREMFSSIVGWLRSIELDARVVYGGSVSILNCQSILDIDDVGGFLLGTSSLRKDFCMISSEMMNTRK